MTELVRVLNPEVCHLALRRPGEAVLLLGNTGVNTSIVPMECAGLLASTANYVVHVYDSESKMWGSGDVTAGAELHTPAVAIEAGGFRVLRFVEA